MLLLSLIRFRTFRLYSGVSLFQAQLFRVLICCLILARPAIRSTSNIVSLLNTSLTIIKLFWTPQAKIDTLSMAKAIQTLSTTQKCKFKQYSRITDGLSFSQGSYFKIPALTISVVAFSFEFYLKQSALSGVQQTILINQDSKFSLQLLSSQSNQVVSINIDGYSLTATVQQDYTEWVHHGVSLFKQTGSKTGVTLYINGIERASQLVGQKLPQITEITVGGTDFEGILQHLRFYDGLIGSQSFSHFAEYLPADCLHGMYYNTTTKLCSQCHEYCDSCYEYGWDTCHMCSALATAFIDQDGSLSCLACDAPGMALSDQGVCEEICGDGIRSQAVECDDGNTNDNDGCSSLCSIEVGFICGGGSLSSRDVCHFIHTLSLKSVGVSADLSLQLYLSHQVSFTNLTLIAFQFSSESLIMETDFAPSMLPLSGKYSSIPLQLNPQQTIQDGTNLAINLSTNEMSTSSLYLTIPSSLSITVSLPYFQYISPDLVTTAKAAGAALDIGSLLLFVGTASAQLCLQSSMEPLWSLINLNQLIFLFPLLSLNIPSNSLLAFQALSFAQGDLLILQFLYSYTFIYIFPSSSSDPYNSKFQALQYESTNFFENSGILLSLLILLLLTLALSTAFKSICRSSRLQKCCSNTSRKLAWNTFLRFFLEAQLDFLLTTILNIKQAEMNSIGGIISLAVAAFFCLFLLSFPFFLQDALSSLDLSSPHIHQRMSEIYSSLKYESSLFSRYFNVFFCFHRVLFVFSVFWLQDKPLSQLSVVFLSSLLFLVYLIKLKPFSEAADNFLYILNTAFLLFLYLVGFLLASPYYSSYESILGSVLLFGILLINLTNLLIILVLKFKSCCCSKPKKCKIRPVQAKYIHSQSSKHIASAHTTESVTPGVLGSMVQYHPRVPGMAEQLFTENFDRFTSRPQFSVAQWGARMLRARER